MIRVSHTSFLDPIRSLSKAEMYQGMYDMTISDRVGRGVQKEQYAVFFKTNKVQILVSTLPNTYNY